MNDGLVVDVGMEVARGIAYEMRESSLRLCGASKRTEGRNGNGDTTIDRLMYLFNSY